MNQTDIQRIKDFEYKYDEVSRVMSALDTAISEYNDIKQWIADLKDYQESGQWLKDFEADERGELPGGLKRGVLAEDALHDLLTSVDNILKQAREL